MTSESSQARGPFGRPGFIAAAVAVGAIVVLAVVLAIVNATRGDSGPVTAPTTAAPTATATDEPSAPSTPEAGASVCGLDGEELEGRLTSAPGVDEWQYQGTTAFPVSRKFGPGATDPTGFRYCFQHSPEGVLFAAANMAAGQDDQATWAEYLLSQQAPNREAHVAEVSGETTGDSSARLAIAGFRLLEYDGDSARVDLAVRGTSSTGETAYVAFNLGFVWEAGDWKFLPDGDGLEEQTSVIPDIAGFVPWGE